MIPEMPREWLPGPGIRPKKFRREVLPAHSELDNIKLILWGWVTVIVAWAILAWVLS